MSGLRPRTPHTPAMEIDIEPPSGNSSSASWARGDPATEAMLSGDVEQRRDPLQRRPEEKSTLLHIMAEFRWVAVGFIACLVFFVCPFMYSHVMTSMPVRLLSPSAEDRCGTEQCVLAAAALLKPLNKTADQCQHPYNFACGSWIESFELPEDESSFAMSFSAAAKENRGIIKRLSEKYSCDAAKELAGSPRSSVDVWDAMYHCSYEACMDLDRREELGSRPLFRMITERIPFLLFNDPIEEARTWSPSEKQQAFSKRLGELTFGFISTPVDVSVKPAVVGSNDKNVLWFGEGGLGLSYRDYEQADIVEKHTEHLENLLTFLMDDLNADFAQTLPMKRHPLTVKERVERVMKLHLDLKSISMTPEQSRDDVATSLPRTLDQVKQMIPAVDLEPIINPLRSYFPDGVHVDGNTQVFISSTTYLPELSKRLAFDTEENSWQWETIHDYFLIEILDRWGGALTTKWREENERYRSERYGIKTPPRWRTCVAANPLQWVIARHFVTETRAERAKTVSQNMIEFLVSSFKSRMHELRWMDDTTRSKAMEKLDRVDFKISHPDWLMHDFQPKFLDYYGTPNVHVVSNSFDSALHFMEQSLRYTLSQLGQPRDSSMWYMVPQTVNAYYNPLQNEIVFPASILRPPFLYSWPEWASDKEKVALKALNFGAIGSVISHELTHGFDDSGKEYDSNGMLVNWWSEKSSVLFKEKTQCFVDQYSDFSVDLLVGNGKNKKLQTFHTSGELTLGENIADNGGVRLSWDAMHHELKDEIAAKGFPLVGVNMTVEELFFLSYSQLWCSVARDEAMRNNVLSDPHSLPQFRVEGVLSNTPAYAQLLKCPNAPQSEEDLTAGGKPICRVW